LLPLIFAYFRFTAKKIFENPAFSKSAPIGFIRLYSGLFAFLWGGFFAALRQQRPTFKKACKSACARLRPLRGKNIFTSRRFESRAGRF
jgi:hypothetical protein